MGGCCVFDHNVFVLEFQIMGDTNGLQCSLPPPRRPRGRWSGEWARRSGGGERSGAFPEGAVAVAGANEGTRPSSDIDDAPPRAVPDTVGGAREPHSGRPLRHTFSLFNRDC